jgi:hypothetical protein
MQAYLRVEAPACQIQDIKEPPGEPGGLAHSIGRNLSAHCGKALAAVDGTVVLGEEGNLRLRPALCAHSAVHFTRTIGGGPAGFPILAAVLTTRGLVLEAALCVELLLTCGESELRPAIPANQRLVLIHGIGNPLT